MREDAVSTGVTTALARLRGATGVDLAFSGYISETGVKLDRFDGAIVGPLRGANLDNGRGLGGRVAAQRRALAIPDYVGAPFITHHYDQIIQAESLRAMAAAPVVVARRPVAVLYAALRTSQRELGRMLDAVVAEARNLEQELAIDAVLANLHATRDHAAEADNAQRARVGDAHARLHLLASSVTDPGVRKEILETAALLVETDRARTGLDSVHLTRRELDVLVLLAAGYANQEISVHLGIGIYTVKGHLKSIYIKLEVASRIEAAKAARRLGIVP